MIRVLALLLAVITASCAHAQGNPGQGNTGLEAAVRGAISSAMQALEAKSYRAAGQIALAAKKSAEDLRDYRLLEQLYSIIAVAGANIGNNKAVLLGNYQSAILRVRAYGARAAVTVGSDIALAMTYESQQNRDFEWPLQIAASHALATMRDLAAEGPPSGATVEQESWAHLMLANSYVRTGRAAMALRHFRRALVLAERGLLDGAAIDHIRTLIHRQEALLPTLPPLTPATCRARPDLDEAAERQCLHAADHALLTGDVPRARRILEALIADARPDHLPEARLPAALALHLLLIESRTAGDAEVIASAIRAGNRLAVREYGTAALLALPSTMATIARRQPDRRLIDLCGHIARRAGRGGDDDLALRFLDIMALMYRQLTEQAEGAALIPTATERVLLLLDATSFARINTYEELAKVYFEAASRSLTSLGELPVDSVVKAVEPFTRDDRGFVFPSAAAAHDLLGQLAILKGFEPDRIEHLTNWIASESSLRGNEAGALILAERLVNMAAEHHAGSLAHAHLLAARAFLLVNPAASTPLTRAAYDIYRRHPGTEGRQVNLLLRLAGEARELGDYDTFTRLIDSAGEIAEATPALPVAIHSEIARWRTDIALKAGDRDGATAHAERALALLATRGDDADERRAHPAMTLAEVYATQNRMAEARALYRRHIAPLADNPLTTGEMAALAWRARFAAIEAYFDPTPALQDELDRLAILAAQAARRDDEVQRLVGRARTFAGYGLKRGAAALAHGLAALEKMQTLRSDTATTREDRALLEVTVGAALLAADQTQTTVAPQ